MKKFTRCSSCSRVKRLALSIVLVLGFALCPHRLHAQIYVGITGVGDRVGKYDSATGATINDHFIDLNSNSADGLLVSGNTLFVSSSSATTIATFDATTGAAINSNFIRDSNQPKGIALSGNILYVADYTANAVSEYNASTGALINSNFITGLSGPTGLLLAGSHLYVTNYAGNSVGEYDATTGTTINDSLITAGLNAPFGLAINGNNLFVSNTGFNASNVGEYDATTGAAINVNFISGTGETQGLAVLGSELLVAPSESNWVSSYDVTTGAVINAQYIAVSSAGPFGTGQPHTLAVVQPVPEPGSVVFLCLGIPIALTTFQKRRSAH